MAYALQCPAMVEVSGQLLGVVLVVAGAIGYLSLVLRRSWAGRGGCSGCHVTKGAAEVTHGKTPEPEKPGGQTAFFPLENLADIARQRREQQGKTLGS